MDTIVIVILVLVVLVTLAILAFVLLKLSKGNPEGDFKLDQMQRLVERSAELSAQQMKAFELLQNQMVHLKSEVGDFAKQVDTKLYESSKTMQSEVRMQFGESQKLIRDITGELEQVKETNKQVFSVTEQLQSLEKVLKHQKQRGVLGEASLSLVLSNVLPPNAYTLQHRFQNGEVVDAAVHTKEGIIPVDAKFSLDNYTRVLHATTDAEREPLEKEFKNDLKKRIDETAKYIRPDEGTLPFAFMYIPAEGIYYDLLVNEVGAVKVNTRNLIDYAYSEKKVIIVSPTTFSAYLQSVLYGFKAFKIEEKAMEIGKRVEELRKHLYAYEEYMKKLGKTLGTSVTHYNDAYKELKKVDKDIVRIAGKDGENGIEPELLEKPGEVE
jgi:DNA recombination protein RmuC